jgi:hypothetical protein
MSDNLEIPTLEESSPKNRSFAFYQKIQADLRDMFKKASKNFCTTPLAVIPDPSSPIRSTASAVETPEDEEDPDDPEPEYGDIQME